MPSWSAVTAATSSVPKTVRLMARMASCTAGGDRSRVVGGHCEFLGHPRGFLFQHGLPAGELGVGITRVAASQAPSS
jgi:hypothetical protein